MKGDRLLSVLLALILPSISLAFQPCQKKDVSPTVLFSVENENMSSGLSRREFFRNAASIIAAGSMLSTAPESSIAEESSKVLVLGGTGFVGSRVVKKLKELGYEVIATSRDGRDGTVPFDVTTEGLNVKEQIQSISKGCMAVISCIGAIGTSNDASINSATGLAAAGAKTAGVDRFVYISVAPEVKTFAKDIDFLKDYMAGKTFSQDAIQTSFPSGSTLIEPTFIHGGDEFKINPPRVAGFYGEFIEALLSSGPVRAITDIAPEGFVKIALEPPVSVDSVASAAVAGALGKTNAVLDTYDKIQEAGSLL